MKRPRRLSPSFVSAIKRPGRYGDGHGGLGLSLLVRPRRAGGLSKTWAQRVILGGKPTNIGLGSYPVVNLTEARSRALSNRRAIEHGGDPRAKSRAVPTFAEAAERTIEIQSQAWKKGSKSEGQWRSTLKKYVLAQLGGQPVDKIQPRDVMRVLLPIWATLPESARRIRQRISIIMRWAIAQGYRTDNPAGDALAVALPRIASADNHMRALPYVRVAGALCRVRASGAHPARALCFEFLALCAVRSSEARFARWSEIDEENAIWTIPAERMKANRTHRVPLSARALQVLSLARKLADASGFVFPSATGRPLGQNSLTRLCRKLGLDCVPHGMRSSFRDWCAERSDAPREVCELALAHVNSNRVERAYRRSDLFDRRRQLMEEWAQYLVGPDSRGESGGR
ncbi:MAG: tyrosine-type recombinase/integrase [Gammaproteobacteria bacterium]|nr:tyrosine-type recombinase/integrase [Gammaproteobacteria bacterium]MYD01852.1 tyrosine-type recombinase/integrase [Gammaproteobacteria bacterium]MYI26061.1 tyrosine-type recombinase/integrase [Gammaproteobacteria bacterium]